MQLLLEKNELLDLGRLVRGVGIYCREGCCWVTVEGDSRDHILQSGENHTIRQSGRVVVTALTQARLQLVQSAPETFALPSFRPVTVTAEHK